jgi:hypothetical protein
MQRLRAAQEQRSLAARIEQASGMVSLMGKVLSLVGRDGEDES